MAVAVNIGCIHVDVCNGAHCIAHCKQCIAYGNGAVAVGIAGDRIGMIFNIVKICTVIIAVDAAVLGVFPLKIVGAGGGCGVGVFLPCNVAGL